MSTYALIGEKLGHSYSKIIHEKYHALRGILEGYDLIEIPKCNLESEFKRISKEYDGINVTIPYKIDVIKFLDSVSDEAKRIGAVNTVKFSPDGIVGYNTDYFGFMATLLKNDITIKDKSVVILGTGGVSKAVLTVCEDMGAKEIVFVSTSQTSVGKYPAIPYSDDLRGDVIINCTPVGMYPSVDMCPLSCIADGFSAVVDTIYNPSETRLMKMAADRGIKAVGGLYMLVAQAVHAQAIWRGQDADEMAIEEIYKELYGR